MINGIKTCAPFRAVLSFLLTIILLLISSDPLKASDKDNDDKFSPEDSALIYAYGGYGYYRWKMMSVDGFLDIFTSDLPSSGIMFDHNSTPYIVKKYGVKSNFYIFSLGLDYLGDTFGLPTEFDSDDEIEKKDDKRAKQLKYLSGIGTGKLSFKFNITRREFDSTITSKGYKTWSGAPLMPIYYYPESGGQVLLYKGDEAAWYTTYTDYEGKLVYKAKLSKIEFGAKYVRYDAPTELKISETGSYGDILMFTENRMVSIFFAADGLTQIKGDFYLKYYVPFNLAGYYYAENDYFEVKNKKPLTTDTLSVTASSSGTFALAYILEHLKLEAGVDYGFYYSSLMLNDAKLKKDVEYPDSISGGIITANAGDRVDIDATRIEAFWGFYLHASVFF